MLTELSKFWEDLWDLNWSILMMMSTDLSLLTIPSLLLFISPLFVKFTKFCYLLSIVLLNSCKTKKKNLLTLSKSEEPILRMLLLWLWDKNFLDTDSKSKMLNKEFWTLYQVFLNWLKEEPLSELDWMLISDLLKKLLNK